MTSTGGERRAIKAGRVKRAFTEAAVKIIMEEGVASVYIRRVADQAGYTFDSLYKYFTSEDELLWYARGIMIGDIAAYMDAAAGDELAGIGGVRKLFGKYLDYFIANPNVFRFFYFYRLNHSEKPEGGEKAVKAFEILTASGFCTAEEAGTMIQTMIYCAHGLLTLSISENDELSLREIRARMDEVIQFLLRDLINTAPGETT